MTTLNRVEGCGKETKHGGLVSVFFTVINKNKQNHKKLKELKRGRVIESSPRPPPGPRPASVLVLALWLAPSRLLPV